MSDKYTDIKFTRFLKKTLPSEEYNEVKAYEPCVVKGKSQGYKVGYRYMFVTADSVQVTNNPPKSILYKIHLKDVIKIGTY